MAAPTYNIMVEQGSTFILSIVWKDPTGVPYDLTGYVARMQLRRSLSDTTVLLEATTTNGYIVLGTTGGTVDVSIPAAVTAALNFVDGVYDIELESGAGIVKRLIQGAVELSKEVTR